jgi:hypothetical protein
MQIPMELDGAKLRGSSVKAPWQLRPQIRGSRPDPPVGLCELPFLPPLEPSSETLLGKNLFLYYAIMIHFSDCDGSAIFRSSSKKVAIRTNSYQIGCDLTCFRPVQSFENRAGCWTDRSAWSGLMYSA